MRIGARRLALIVFAAAGVSIVASFAGYQIIGRPNSGLALGFSGMFLPTLLFFIVCPALVLDAGVLALRKRPATNPEVLALGLLAGSVLFVGLLMAAEPFLGELPTGMLFVIGSSWMAILLTAAASLVVITVQTIRAPRAVSATRPMEDDRAHA